MSVACIGDFLKLDFGFDDGDVNDDSDDNNMITTMTTP